MGKRKVHVCKVCHRLKERCKAASVDQEGDVEWVCPSCWAEYEFDAFVTPGEEGYGHGV